MEKQVANKLELKRLQIAIIYFAKEYYNCKNHLPALKEICEFVILVDLSSVITRGKPVFGLDLNLNEKIENTIGILQDNFQDNNLDINYYMKYFAIAEKELIEQTIKAICNNEVSYDNIKEMAFEITKENTVDKLRLIYENKLKNKNTEDKDYLINVFEGYKDVKECFC